MKASFCGGQATALLQAGCGELVQGTLDGEPALVTCPLAWYSRATVQLIAGAAWAVPAGLAKTAAALRAGCRHLGIEAGLRLRLTSTAPRGRGYGSSTADIGAALYALGAAAGSRLAAGDVGRLAVAVEPTDSTIFEGLALYAYRTGAFVQPLGPPPALVVLVCDPGEAIDTLAYNRVDRSAALHKLAGAHREAFALLAQGVGGNDPEAIGAAATLSARLHQTLLFNPLLDEVLQLCAAVHGLGVCRAHSGSLLGVLLDPRRAELEAVQAYGQRCLAGRCDLARHQMTGGGPIYGDEGDDAKPVDAT